MYKINITKIEEKDGFEREYKQIAATGNKSDDGPIYGYVDKPVKEKVETTILLQMREEIDIEAVIKAVNAIE